MGYSTQALVEDILANALTKGTPSASPVNIINIGNQVRDTVSTATMIQYIRWADEEIDGALSSIYLVPLKRIVKGEYELLAGITAGSSSISVEDSTRFNVGDLIVVTDRTTSEKKVIDTIPDETTITVTVAFVSSFLVSGTVVQRIGYPDPISLCSARRAAANLYDKYFASQSNVNTSDYGNRLRLMAENDFNNVLNGRIKLHGQKFLGRRFFNPALLDVNSIASEQMDREKPQ
jgi:hypothetical protein